MKRIKLDHHEEATSGRKYQDPADLHNAVYNTNGYMHEDDPNDGNFFQGVAIGLGLSVGIVAIVFVLVNIAQ